MMKGDRINEADVVKRIREGIEAYLASRDPFVLMKLYNLYANAESIQVVPSRNTTHDYIYEVVADG